MKPKTKPKHTPGPWEHYEDGDRTFINGQEKLGGQTLSVIVAELYEDPGGANARLITAAPDLLKACKNSVEWLKINCPFIEPNELLAAIAKATGESK